MKVDLDSCTVIYLIDTAVGHIPAATVVQLKRLGDAIVENTKKP